MSLAPLRPWVRSLVIAHALATTLACRRAGAQPSSQLEWSSEWPRFRPVEVVFTSVMGLQLTAAVLLYPEPRPRLHGGVLFDDALRDAFRLRERSARDRASTASDVLYYTLAAYPLFDLGLALGRGGSSVAQELFAMDLEAYALSGALAITLEKIGRVRPAERGCRSDANYSEKCRDEAALSSSFMSGHTTIAFTSAGLACAHHTNLPLYGNRTADLGACALALAAASTTGALRVLSDNHYSTDVLLGAAVGLLSGYGLPTLLHYRRRALPNTQENARPLNEPSALVAPTFDNDHFGLVLVGVF